MAGQVGPARWARPTISVAEDSEKLRKLFEVASALERVGEEEINAVVARYLVAPARTVVVATPSGDDES